MLRWSFALLLLLVALTHAQCICITNDDCPDICDSSFVQCGYTGGPVQGECCAVSTCEGLATFFPVCIPDDAIDDCYGPLPIDFCESLTCAVNCTSGAGNCTVDGTACVCEETEEEDPTPAQPLMATGTVLGLCFGSLGGGALLILVVLVVKRNRENKQMLY